mmetsp:Transcript_2389/g.5913  ORF Transcript_2389/g.5913 Transcript_2389/m.5913 type:complete len:485 (+) Transcript_2389:164-1618(+)
MPAYSSFHEEECFEGYKCYSKISYFGEHHAGPYDKNRPIVFDKRFENAYEEGCPARGKLVRRRCTDTKKGPESYCFSNTRYESGPGQPCDTPEKCICARPLPFEPKSSDQKESIDGESVINGPWEVTDPDPCYNCSQHGCDLEACNKCKNCEYITHTIRYDGGKHERKQPGCYDKLDADEFEVRRRGEKLWLRGRAKNVTVKHLEVIPRQEVWRPHLPSPFSYFLHPDADFSLPYENVIYAAHARDEWRQEYVENGPALQKLMDILVVRLLEGTQSSPAWTKRVGNLLRKAEQRCWTKQGSLTLTDDLASRFDKFTSVQRHCKLMQSIAASVAANETFPARGSGRSACGAYYWDKEKQTRMCGCKLDEDGKRCARLNCYTDNKDVHDAIDAIKRRLHLCASVSAASDAEIEENGPAPMGNAVVENAGKIETVAAFVPADILLPIADAARSACHSAGCWRGSNCTSKCASQRRWRRSDIVSFLCP